MIQSNLIAGLKLVAIFFVVVLALTFVCEFIMADKDKPEVLTEEDERLAIFLRRGKLLGLQDQALIDYVDKLMTQDQERQERLEAKRIEWEHKEKLEKEKLGLEKDKLENQKQIAIETAKQETERQKATQDAALAKVKEDAEVERERLKQLEETRRTEMMQATVLETERLKQAEETKRVHFQSKTMTVDGDSSVIEEQKTVGPRPVFPKLPHFKEKSDDIDSYLFRFEQHASMLKWPKENWLTYLSALLDGTALTLYHSLSEIGTLTYETLKESLLKKFQCTAEGFRKRFREAKPVVGEPFETYAVELRRLFDRWLSLSGAQKTYDDVVNMILSEQLIESVSKDVATFLCEKDIDKFDDLVHASESYRRAHPNTVMARKGSSVVFGNVSHVNNQSGGQQYNSRGGQSGNFRGGRGSGYGNLSRGGSSSGNGQFNRGGSSQRGGNRGGGFQNSRGGRNRGAFSNDGQKSSTMTCWLCREVGHAHTRCPWRSGTNPCGLCNFSHPSGSCPIRERNVAVASGSGSSQSAGAALVVCSLVDEFTGQLHLESGSVNGSACSVLRDTGATVCGVRKRLVRDDQYTGKSVKCISFGGRMEEFPLAEVQVESDHLSGSVLCCVLDAPVADLIVGNVPGVENVFQSAECGMQSAAAVTRARAKHDVVKKPLSDVPEVLNVTPAELIALQKDDKDLTKCFELARSGEVREAGGTSHYFYVQDGILFRCFRKGVRQLEQVVLPTSLRSSVLVVAHDVILAGHCGARRTLARLREKFFWPGMTVDVAKYVASCDACQRNTSKGKVAPVPMKFMPVIDVPFDRVAIDLVGPIKPASEKGHKYILTLIDVATRYPEAVPLKDISSVSVANALFEIFSRLGFPKEILSDQGTQFNSELMKQFHQLCGCKGIRTSPYHPQANGTVERFHGTLKSMLAKVVQRQPKLWYRYLPALLFACRELPSESTGFSPFRLLFGREIRGPLSLLHESWTGQDQQDCEAKPLYQYVFDLQNMILETAELAKDNSIKASVRNKKYFDRKSKERAFQVGDRVLVLLPSDTNKLLSTWLGPYPVLEVMHPDYRILVKGKEKVFHANMLKKYVERETQASSCVQCVDKPRADVSVGECQDGGSAVLLPDMVVPWDLISPCSVQESSGVPGVRSAQVLSSVPASCTSALVQEDDAFQVPTLPTPMSTSTPDEGMSDIKFDDCLSGEQVTQLREVFCQFESLLTTKPGCFSGDVELHISLVSDVPVRRKSYDVPLVAMEVIDRELKTMLDLGVIEHSRSPYAAPVVLIRKTDGSCRFCIDYRWLNKITEFDAEPIPDVEELFAALSSACFFTRVDMAKGYWQIRVRPEDRPKTAFVTKQGLFQFVRMPFGLVSAPAVFARMMRMLDLQSCSAVNFFDDILVYSSSWQAHLLHVRAVLQKLQDFGLTARPSKIQAGFRSLEFLGHVVGSGTLRPAEQKVQKILQLEKPTTKKQVRSLVGLIGFYRRYVPNFASIIAPLTDLTKDGPRTARSIQWTAQCTEALQKIQQLLSGKPVLLLPRMDRTFVLRTDASSLGLGAVLLQEEDGCLHPVAFASKKLLQRECNYSTIERECLAIVWAVQKFLRFLWGVRFVLQTDHRPLTFLRTSEFKNGRILRWALSLQEFTFDVEPIPGSANIFADLLSRTGFDQSGP